MSISTDDLGRITQQTAVVATDGDSLGTINQIYTSDSTGEPAWVTLKTGLFGSQESFVPLADASFEGDDIRVGVSKAQVHGAPRVDADGHLSVAEEDDLYRYYGLHNPGQRGGGAAGTGDAGRDDVGRNDDRTDRDREDVTDRDRDDHDRDRDLDTSHGGRGRVVDVGAGTAGAVAMAGPGRDDELAERDAEGRDEVSDRPDVTARRAPDDDRTAGSGDDEAVRPGERTTQLRRYVVTERVVQTVEELPDEPSR